MKTSLRTRHERELRTEIAIGKMRLTRGYDSRWRNWGVKLGEERKKDSRGQLLDTRALKAHRAGATGMEREWNVQGRNRVDMERRAGAWRKCIHSSLFASAIFLHPLSPLCLFADTPAPIGNGAFGLDAAPYR